MKNQYKVFLPILASLSISACGGGGGGTGSSNNPPTPTFNYTIDSSIAPVPANLGSHPLGAVQDSAGRTSIFKLDELIINTSSQTELDHFLSSTGGVVIGDNSIADPPANSGITMDPKYKQATQYLVQVDATAMDLTNFGSDVVAAGMSGKSNISSDAAARLLALAAHESTLGYKISPNFVGTDSGYLFNTTEQPNGSGGNFNALTQSSFSSAPSSSRSNVAKAWQWIAAMGHFTPVKVAVIDGGFWLDNTGHPQSSLASPVSDLPDMPLQYDLVQSDTVADGANLAHCSGGGVCNWHGNNSVGVAVGTMNNQYGMAGTGSQVATPILLKTDLSWDQVSRGIRTAVAWGANVISMSFGGECDNVFCDGYFETNLYPALRNARDNNVIAVAAAGNGDGRTGVNTHDVPCKGDAVICVGALADNTHNAIGYSNYGPFVDIWAPTDILTMPNGDTAPNLALHNGTSASAPFVAGIVAMLKAYNPSLSSDQVLSILQSTGWHDSTDPKVNYCVNALAALQNVTGPLPADTFEPNNTSATATAMGTISPAVSPIDYADLTLPDTADRDNFRFTLADYTHVNITLTYVANLANVNAVLIKESGAPDISDGYTNVTNVQGRALSADLPPGTYRLVVSADNPNAYDLNFELTSLTLLPDMFEPNESITNAAPLPSPGTGSFRVNLQNLTDVDFYQISQLSNGFMTYQFEIPHRDMPLTMRMYDSTGTQIDSMFCDVTGPCGLAVPSGSLGTHTVEVQNAGQRGYYTIQGEQVLNRNAYNITGFGTDPIYYLDRNLSPIQGFLANTAHIYGFVMDVKATQALLSGGNVSFSLYDQDGNLLEKGTPITNSKILGESLPLTGLISNQLYLIKVEPKSVPNTIDGETGILPNIPYSVQLSS